MQGENAGVNSGWWRWGWGGSIGDKEVQGQRDQGVAWDVSVTQGNGRGRAGSPR